MRSAKRETGSGARYRPLQPGCAVGKPALARILPLEWLCAVAAGVVPVQRRGSSYRRVGRLGHRRGLARAMRGCAYSGRCVCAVSTLPTLECWHMQVACGSASEPRRSHRPSAHLRCALVSSKLASMSLSPCSSEQARALLMHSHTRARTHARARAGARTKAHACTHMCARTHPRVLTRVLTRLTGQCHLR
jgi:hypothetical protein